MEAQQDEVDERYNRHWFLDDIFNMETLESWVREAAQMVNLLRTTKTAPLPSTITETLEHLHHTNPIQK